MLADLLTPTVSVEYLGSNAQYDVYRVVFGALFATIAQDQHQYQTHVDALLDQAHGTNRRVWLALDSSRLRKRDTLRLLYRFAIPNLSKPITIRPYNVDDDPTDELDQEFSTMIQLIRLAQRSTSSAKTFQDALPPGFAPQQLRLASDSIVPPAR